MRILYFSRDYTSHDYRFLTGLAKTGHVIGYLRLERSAYPQELRPLPAEVREIPWKGGKGIVQQQESLTLINDLRRVLQAFNPDVVLAGPIQKTAYLVALTGFQPLVSMSWGYDLLIDAKQNAVWSWMTMHTLKNSAAMVCDCETTRLLAVSYGMDPQKIVTFPWGVDLDHFSPCQEERKIDIIRKLPLTLLSTRSWEPVYGMDVLAEGFVKASRRQQNLQLIMLNGGSQKETIQKILAPIPSYNFRLDQSETHSKPAVLFGGQIPYSELPSIYRQADLYLAATHSDGTSISMLEAMACGLPVMVSDIPGNREWVVTGHNGWLFSDGDSNALASAILSAYQNRDRLIEMGRAARQIAETRANWNRNFPKLMNAFEIALKLPAGALHI